MKTKLTDLLGIKYPIIQGAMGWVSNTPPLVIAVSKAGGLGIMAGARLSSGELRNNIRKIRKHTDKPFGVNLTPRSNQVEEQLEVMVEERVPVFSYGRGSPAHYRTS